MKRFVALVFILALIVGSSGVFVAGYALYDVFMGDYSHLTKEKILQILSKESIVYFDDGESQVGSLFGGEHRQYVPFAEIPKPIYQAVIAAEDDSFYEHIGLDFLSTARAVIRNIIYRRREGASTITQQTVKNLYGRPVTNLRAKYFEAINAFKMERVYSKDEILEFYLNQFHVVGNGRGVGVAALYYFNKEVRDLNLVESAFIAGSVKGPELYNPFTKRSLQSRNRAIERARQRTAYVLGRMRDLKFISEEDYAAAVDQPVPFDQGRFQFNQLSVVDLVKRQLGRAEVLEALGVENVDQIASLGLKITTTLKKDIQEAAQYGVRQNLSRLGIILKGFQLAPSDDYRSLSRLMPLDFHVGKVFSVDQTPGKELIDVSFGLAHCVIPAEGVERVAKFLDYGVYKGLSVAKQQLFRALAPGETVLVSVKSEMDLGDLPPWLPPELAAAAQLEAERITQQTHGHANASSPGASDPAAVSSSAGDSASNPERQLTRLYQCDLESPPELNGAAIAIDKGEILAVVGGYSPTEYNRAVYARRQPGSTFKTHTFFAALHLGWNALDPLLNVRDAYVWQGQFYYPRPDHVPPSLTTTLVGAGSLSENLASIWLLAHLTRKLTPSQFWSLLDHLEVANGRESEDQLKRILRDQFNVTFQPKDLSEGVLSSLVEEYTQDLAVVADRQLYVVLMTLSAGGRDYDNEIARLTALRDRDVGDSEKSARLAMLRNNLQRWRRLSGLFEKDIQVIKEQIELGNTYFDGPELSRFRITEAGRLAYMGEAAVYKPHLFSRLLPEVTYQNATPREVLARFEEYFSAPAADFESDVWLDGALPETLLSEISAAHDERLQQVAALPLSERVPWNADLRYSVGMLFAKRLVERMGVLSPLNWVPSFPLGTSDVSLAELAMSYQTLVQGEAFRFFNDDEAVNQLSLVRRIEDASGNLLWESTPEASQVFDPFYTPSILSILRGTVTHGTGRLAGNALLLDGSDLNASDELKKAKIRIPSFGKTGTTNDYVNATYVGVLPYPEFSGSTRLSVDRSVTIATYVGYDDNQQMKRGGVRIAGGTGALPAWIEIAKAVVRYQKFSEKLDWKKMIDDQVSEVAFDYGEASTVTVPLHSSVVLSSSLDDTLVKQTQDVDLNSFADDYAVRSDQVVTVALPGLVERGVFNPRTKVGFPEASPLEKLPEAIPQLPVFRDSGEPFASDEPNEALPQNPLAAHDRGDVAPERDSQEPADRSAARESGGAANQADEESSDDFSFLIPPPPPPPLPDGD